MIGYKPSLANLRRHLFALGVVLDSIAEGDAGLLGEPVAPLKTPSLKDLSNLPPRS